MAHKIMDDETPAPLRAAGVLISHGDRVLMLQRADLGNLWAFPGGKIEEGETPEEAARRECGEEIGFSPSVGRLGEFARRVADDVDFTTFVYALDPAEYPDGIGVMLNDEHTGYQWLTPEDALNLASLHPGAAAVLRKVTGTELDVARMIRDGDLTSPQRFHNVWLFDLRITGTGAAYRTQGEEFAWRDPALYLNDEFLARCNGLPVIFEHPEGATLTSEEYADRNVGSIFLPYIKGEDVRGVAKVFDDDTVNILLNMPMSTSPTVVLAKNTSSKANLDDGDKILIEGNPKLLDHVAICARGVWDKAGEPQGVISMATETGEDDKKTETAAADADKMPAWADALCTKMDAMADSVADLKKRADAAEAPAAKEEPKDDKPEELAADAKKDGADDRKQVAEADKAKADEAEALKTKIADLDSRMPKELSDAETEEMAEASHKADSLAQAFGDKPTRPMPGERPANYRRRFLDRYKAHSPAWKDADLTKVDSVVLGIAETQVFADALAAADAPGDPAQGLREVRKTGPGGHQISEFRGDIRATYEPFRAQAQKFGTLR